MNIRKLGVILMGPVLALLLVGCGGTPTPHSALTKQFQSITKLYPFHVDLAKDSQLYFLVPASGVTVESRVLPVAAVVHRYKGNWLVWQYGPIWSATPQTDCPVSVSSSSAPLTAAPYTGQAKTLIFVGQLEGDWGSVGSLSYSLGGEAYRAKLLPDGLWYVLTKNGSGRVVITLKDRNGHPMCTSNS